MAGSGFTEIVKHEARRLAAFKCCYCRDEMGDDVHHLVPQEEGGGGELNAIFLCALCHRRYGHVAEKRAQLRQARDDWYEIVRDKYSRGQIDLLENLATKNDMREIKEQITILAQAVLSNIDKGMMTRPVASTIAATMVSSISFPVRAASLSFKSDPPLVLITTTTLPAPKKDDD